MAWKSKSSSVGARASMSEEWLQNTACCFVSLTARTRSAGGAENKLVRQCTIVKLEEVFKLALQPPVPSVASPFFFTSRSDHSSAPSPLLAMVVNHNVFSSPSATQRWELNAVSTVGKPIKLKLSEDCFSRCFSCCGPHSVYGNSDSHAMASLDADGTCCPFGADWTLLILAPAFSSNLRKKCPSLLFPPFQSFDSALMDHVLKNARFFMFERSIIGRISKHLVTLRPIASTPNDTSSLEGGVMLCLERQMLRLSVAATDSLHSDSMGSAIFYKFDDDSQEGGYHFLGIHSPISPSIDSDRMQTNSASLNFTPDNVDGGGHNTICAVTMQHILSCSLLSHGCSDVDLAASLAFLKKLVVWWKTLSVFALPPAVDSICQCISTRGLSLSQRFEVLNIVSREVTPLVPVSREIQITLHYLQHSTPRVKLLARVVHSLQQPTLRENECERTLDTSSAATTDEPPQSLSLCLPVLCEQLFQLLSHCEREEHDTAVDLVEAGLHLWQGLLDLCSAEGPVAPLLSSESFHLAKCLYFRYRPIDLNSTFDRNFAAIAIHQQHSHEVDLRVEKERLIRAGQDISETTMKARIQRERLIEEHEREREHAAAQIAALQEKVQSMTEGEKRESELEARVLQQQKEIDALSAEQSRVTEEAHVLAAQKELLTKLEEEKENLLGHLERAKAAGSVQGQGLPERVRELEADRDSIFEKKLTAERNLKASQDEVVLLKEAQVNSKTRLETKIRKLDRENEIQARELVETNQCNARLRRRLSELQRLNSLPISTHLPLTRFHSFPSPTTSPSLSRRQRSLLSQPKVRDFWELDVAELFEQDSLLKNKIAHFLIKVDAAFGGGWEELLDILRKDDRIIELDAGVLDTRENGKILSSIVTAWSMKEKVTVAMFRKVTCDQMGIVRIGRILEEASRTYHELITSA